MSKLQLAGVTLIAAIPSAFLMVLLVMAFLNHSGQMKPLLQGIAGLTLLPAVAGVLLPVGAFLFFAPKSQEALAGDPLTGGFPVYDGDESDEIVDDEGMELADDDEEEVGALDDDDGAIEDDGSFHAEMDDDDMEQTSDFEAVVEDLDDFGDDTTSEDDDFLDALDDSIEDEPKKKKKR